MWLGEMEARLGVLMEWLGDLDMGLWKSEVGLGELEV